MTNKETLSLRAKEEKRTAKGPFTGEERRLPGGGGGGKKAKRPIHKVTEGNKKKATSEKGRGRRLQEGGRNCTKIQKASVTR